MVPHDLTPRRLELPPTEDPSIVIVSGADLRHRRFAHRIQQEFGERVRGWFEVSAPPAPTHGVSRWGRLGRRLRARIAETRDRGGLAAVAGLVGRLPGDVARKWQTRRLGLLHADRQRRCEEAMFAEEVRRLGHGRLREPVRVADSRGAAFLDAVHRLSPYFLLSLGGPLYRGELLDAVRGVPLNQHAGWAPQYRGSSTVDWALYHRDLLAVGNTVHITTRGADAGPIVRRSHPALLEDESPESCFARVVALGTELMIEVVHEATANGALEVYDQPRQVGRTYLGRELTPDVLARVERDFAGGWLADALRRRQGF